MNTFADFIEKEQHIYTSLRKGSDQVGISAGLSRDPGVEPQSAFLIYWRYPLKFVELVQEFSEEVNEALKNDGDPGALVYGPSNAHTTLSDFKLNTGQIITPTNPNQLDTLNRLTVATSEAVVLNMPLSDLHVEFGKPITTGKTVIIPGTPTEQLWQVNQIAINHAAALEVPLKGSWGTHMTASRFLHTNDVHDPRTTKLRSILDSTPEFGRFAPTSLDVGYFHTDPQNGFVLSSHASLEW